MQDHPEPTVDQNPPPLIGRASEFARLTYFVEEPSERRATLVVVSGQDGFGKSVFVGQAARLAVERGWRVVMAEDGESELVTPVTTVDDFRTAMRRWLDKTSNSGPQGAPSEPAERPAFRYDARDTTSPTPSVSPLAALTAATTTPPPGLVGQEVLPRITRWALGPEGSRLLAILKNLTSNLSVAASSVPEPLTEQLALQPPTLLVIDNFRPSTAFGSWFAARFVGDLRRVHAAILLLVATRTGASPDVEQAADEVITIGPLEPRAVTAYFTGLNVQPPLTGSELAEYVNEICQRPGKLPSLLHVLNLLAPVTSPVVPPSTGTSNGQAI